MERKEIENLIKEWRRRVSFVRAEILEDLRKAAHPNRAIETEYLDPENPSQGVVYRTVGETDGPFCEARDRQIENECRISEIESILKGEGIDPFTAGFNTLLFVDTESSNCFNDVYKMCEYGQIGTDLSFNERTVLRKDILMSPGYDGKFNLVGRKGHRDLTLSHSYAEYKKSPTFARYYDDIAFFLCQKTSMVFMWAAENDVQALLDQCMRYDVPTFPFVSYDVQHIFMKEFPEFDGRPSLEKAAAFLELNLEGITQHKPDDDAFLTMLILKGIVEKTGKTILELIRDCPLCQCESTKAYYEMKKSHKEKAARIAMINKRKAELAPYHEELNGLLSTPVPEETPLEKLFAVSLEMKMHVDEALPKIKEWIGNGYHLKRNLNVAYLVAYDEAEIKHLKSVLDTSRLKIVLPDEFERICLPKA